jgi:class 3 adenylate cyclase
MAWDGSRSLERAKAKWSETDGLTVSDLVRETDFDSTALKNPRKVDGAHVYVDIPDFRCLLGTGDPDPVVARRLHLWAREVTKVVETDFEATKVHFQGPRLHAVVYRPVGDAKKIAVKAVLLAASVRATATEFNNTLGLTGDDRWGTAAGVDIGSALLTKDGVKGDRELLFLGNPANVAAKIIPASGLRLTDDVANQLPDDLAKYVKETADGNGYVFSTTALELEALCSSHGFGWTCAKSGKRIADGDAAAPQVTVVESKGAIDKAILGLGHTNRTFGLSLFADVDGFTKHIEQADADDVLDEAVRAFHVIRAETRNTAVADYDSLRIQYQGDRMQALVHLPSGEQENVAEKAVRVAAALNSVFVHTLPPVLGDTGLSLATGLAAGNVLVTKVGEHGNRDVVSLGRSTAEAARIQEAIDSGEIGVDKDGYALLPEWLQAAFTWRIGVNAYVASDLTLDEVDLLEAAEATDRAQKIIGAAAFVSDRPDRHEPPLKPYWDGC